MLDHIPLVKEETIQVQGDVATRDLQKRGENVVLKFLMELEKEQPHLFFLLKKSLLEDIDDFELNIKVCKIIMLFMKSINSQISLNEMEEN